MSGELAPKVKGAAALLAAERLVPGVNVVVLLEVAGLPEVLVAVVALVGQPGVVGVLEHVDRQSGQDCGLVVALLAHVAGQKVSLFMTSQVAIQPEFFRTVLASQVPGGVSHQVLLEVAPVPEDLAANIADQFPPGPGLSLDFTIDFLVAGLQVRLNLPPVALHVITKTRQGPEDTPALLAGVPRGSPPVKLCFVLLKDRLRGEEPRAGLAVVRQRHVFLISILAVFSQL